MKIQTRPVAGCSICGAYAHHPDLIGRSCDRKTADGTCPGVFRELTDDQCREECPECGGRGRCGDEECGRCNGRGLIDVWV